MGYNLSIRRWSFCCKVETGATRSLGQAFALSRRGAGGVQQTHQDHNTGKKQEKDMDTTVTIEFTAETHQHLRGMEHQYSLTRNAVLGAFSWLHREQSSAAMRKWLY